MSKVVTVPGSCLNFWETQQKFDVCQIRKSPACDQRSTPGLCEPVALKRSFENHQIPGWEEEGSKHANPNDHASYLFTASVRWKRWSQGLMLWHKIDDGVERSL